MKPPELCQSEMKHATSPGEAASFGGIKALKEHYPNVPIKEIEKFVQTQDWYTKHRQATKKFPRNRVIASGIDAQWQVDLVDLSIIAKHNRNVKFLLTSIDIVSRFACVEPMKNKSADSTLQALKRIFRKSGRKPIKIQSDQGKEFWNTKVQRFFKSQGIKHFSTNSETKAALVERFNKTLKNKMWRYFTHNNTYKYIDVLQDFVKSYNNTKHGVTKYKPAAVNASNERFVLRNLYADLWTDPAPLKFKFSVGDRVRISVEKGAFGRGYLGNFSEEIFTVIKRYPREPPVYVLADWHGNEIKGIFYAQQLQKVRVDPSKYYKVEKVIKKRKRGNRVEYFVKWLDYPAEQNSWIPAADLKRL